LQRSRSIFTACTRGSSLWDARPTPYDVRTGNKLPHLVSLRVAYSKLTRAMHSRASGSRTQRIGSPPRPDPVDLQDGW